MLDTDCLRMCVCARRKKTVGDFPCHNWLIIYGLLLGLCYTVFIMFTPSIYQFVTAAKDSSEESEKNGSNTLWPGLNGTERDYALVSVSFALFETVLFPLPMLMMDSLPFTLLMLLTFSLFTVAGVVYGCATHIWMVFVARGLMGAAALFASSIIYTYTGEIGSIMDMERLKMGKKPIKGSLYLAITFTTHGYHIILLGINAGLVRIPSVNPYRLPGWFLIALGVTAAIIVLLFFSETRPWTCRFKSSCDITSGWSDFRKMRSKSKSYLIGVAFVFANAYVTGQAFALLYTLVSPILSDQFGFTVDNTALFFTALAVGGLASPFVQFCSQALKCNNRVRMAFALVTIVIGNTLISDWQVLYYKENPCYLPSPGDNGTTDVVDGNNITSSFENINDHINSTFEWNIDNCEGKSTSNHECFWNPSSRVTGDHCHTCHNACLSKQAFLNFYQFNIGVLFLSVGATLAYVFNFALLSDIVPPENQGSITVLTVTSGAFARAVTPLWYVESYEQTGKHTFLPLSVTNATILLVLVALAVLYKDLAPRCSTEAKAATNATALECSIVDGQ